VKMGKKKLCIKVDLSLDFLEDGECLQVLEVEEEDKKLRWFDKEGKVNEYIRMVVKYDSEG
jgi:hypothetical protein